MKYCYALCLFISLFFIPNNLFAQAPTITSFSPTSGSIGTLVTIIGTNLNNLDTIKIGGVSAIKISAKTDTLVAMVMPGAVTGNIYLTNSSGNVTSGSSFTKINNILPNTQQANKLVGSGGSSYATQGNSVCLSADGNTALIGGYADNSYQGASWVYTRNGGVWSQQGNKLVGIGNIGAAYQGHSVGLSADGNTAIIGGFGDNSNQGAVWIFTRNGNVWSQQGNKLVGTGAVGAAQQGGTVSLSADGNTAIVGGPFDSIDRGAAWVYSRSNGVWSQVGNKLVGTGAIGAVWQGYSVSISSDGATAILGGISDNSNQGAAWIFTRNGGIWNQQGSKLIGTGNIGAAQQGYSVSLSADGNTAMIGGANDNSGQGATWIFTRNGGIWSQQGNKLVGTGNIGAANQGFSVSLSADGNKAIIGGWKDNSNQGAAWLYFRSGTVWNQQGSKLVGTGSVGTSVYQGVSVNMSADGNNGIIGGYLDNSGKGAVWVFYAFRSTNANLNTLTISAGILSPTFSANILFYKVGVSNSTTNITLTPTKADSNATIQVRVNGGVFTTVASGSMSGALSLNIGNNTIEVKVTASDSFTNKIYTTIVTRTSPPTISTFLPNSGPIGTLVTITGTNLNNIDTIKIGGVSAIKIADKTDTLIAMVMPGAITGNIYLVNASGSVTSGINFTKTNSITPSVQQGNKLVGIGGVINPAHQGEVCISADGNTAIVGGRADSNSRGAAWVYTRNETVWSQQGNKLVGTGSVGTLIYQGTSVALSADGNTAIVGGNADGNAQGAVWIFTRSGGVWSQQGNKLVGTGSIGSTIQQGCAVSLSADGNTALVGAFTDNTGQGAVWIYTRNAGVWSQQGNKLVGTGSIGTANQGGSVSLSADGNTAIVGGRGDNNDIGAVWIYTRNAGIWSQQGNKLVGSGTQGTFSYQGCSVNISADGNTAIIGGNIDNNNQGASWIFTRNLGVWSQQGNKLVGTGNIGAARQGHSVSLSADGSIVLVSGNYDNSNIGATWVYTRSGNSWSQHGSKLVGSGAIGQSEQGSSVSISANGNTAIVGGFNDNNNTGAAWVFTGSTNPNLANLLLNFGVLSPSFNKNITSYTTTLSNSITNLSLTPFKSDSFANIQIQINNGNYVAINSGVTSNALILNVGINTVNIKVTAQDGTTIKIYTITINSLPSTNAKLSNINLIGIPYLPSFHSDTLIYSAPVLFGVNNVRVSFILSDTSARIKIKMNSGIFTNINNKDTSALLPLNVGVNTIAIKVTAQDTSVTRNYLMNITRAAAVAPTSMSYSPSNMIATRTVTSINAITTYSGSSIDSFNITPSLPMGVSLNTLTGTISGTPAITLPQTVFTITGINVAGSTTANFTLTVNRIAPSNLKYNDSIVVATRTITNINSSVNYSGDSITSFSINPALPSGVILNTSTGFISGIPTVTLPPTTFTITGTNNGGSTTANFTLTVNRIAPTNLKYNDSIVIANRTITNVNSSVTYSGDSIASFSISPSLPSGVTLNTSTGLISGIPTLTLPLTTFTITGTNNGGSTTASFWLTVNSIAPTNLKYIDSIVFATRTITSINSSVTYLGDSIASFSITPSLPIGVILNSTTGLISGIPTVTLPLTVFTITGSNSAGNTTATFTLTVHPALSINEVNSSIFSNINFKPNPFTNEVEISFVSTTKEATKLLIIDAVGKEVFVKNIQSNIGNNNIIIDEIAHLKSGIYFARLANNNGLSQSFKLVKE